VDAAWEDLYNGMIPLHTSTSTVFYELTQVPDIGLSQIDKLSARRLPNKTALIPGDEEHYIVGLDVFHQLHCLVSIPSRHIARQGPHELQNHIRKSLHPNRYPLHENLTDSERAPAMEHLGKGFPCLDLPFSLLPQELKPVSSSSSLRDGMHYR
jgi:hypothetical protein